MTCKERLKEVGFVSLEERRLPGGGWKAAFQHGKGCSKRTGIDLSPCLGDRKEAKGLNGNRKGLRLGIRKNILRGWLSTGTD